MKIAISNDRAELGKIMQGDIPAWREFNGSFVNVDIKPIDLMQRVQAGFAYTAQHKRYRSADNFICAQHIALDMDTEDERSSIAVLSVEPFFAEHASFIHTTPSHTAAKPKARVVFVLDRPIRSVDKYAELAQSLVHRFESSDRACKDPARFFYGAKGCDVAWLGNILTLENAAKELVLPYREYVANLERKAAEAAKNRVVVGNGDVPEALLKKHSQTLLDRVEMAPDGEKYITLRDTAITFGGYVAGGYYSRLDVVSWLQSAILSNPNNVQDKHAAFAAIEESITYGMARPLYFEVNQTAVNHDELSTVHPPLSDSQKEQVTQIISRKLCQAYHDGMNQQQRETWRNYFADSIIDYFQLGYCGERTDKDTGEIETLNALTVPFLDIEGNTVNVEYRNGSVTYEVPTPHLFLTDRDNLAKPTLILPDSITALTTSLHYGSTAVNVVGLPHMALASNSLDVLQHEDITLLLEPDTPGQGLQPLKGHARVVRLPFTIDKLRGLGVTRQEFGWFTKQGRLWL